jgi:hypothetical protein
MCNVPGKAICAVRTVYARGLPLLLACAAATGCVRHRVLAPVNVLTTIPLEAAGITPADYTVLGDTYGQSSGGRILFFIPYGDSPWEHAPPPEGDSDLPPPPLDGRSMAAAVKAISWIPDANAMLQPRVAQSSYDFLVWSTWTVTVSGKAIALHVPNAPSIEQNEE